MAYVGIKIVENIFKLEFEKQEKKFNKHQSKNHDGWNQRNTRWNEKTWKRNDRPKTKPWIHRKHSDRESKKAWWKACELGEPMQWTL